MRIGNADTLQVHICNVIKQQNARHQEYFLKSAVFLRLANPEENDPTGGNLKLKVKGGAVAAGSWFVGLQRSYYNLLFSSYESQNKMKD